MAIASDYWKVVADAICDVHVDQNNVDVADEPEHKFRRTTKFLIDFQAVIRRITSVDADRLSNLDDVISRRSETKASIQLESSKSHGAAVVSKALRKLKVPLSERDNMVERIMRKAADIEMDNKCFLDKVDDKCFEIRKIAHLMVIIDLIVVDDDGEDTNEEDIVVCCLEGSHDYSDSSMVEQLQKTGVCPMCDEDRKAFVAKMENEEIL